MNPAEQRRRCGPSGDRGQFDRAVGHMPLRGARGRGGTSTLPAGATSNSPVPAVTTCPVTADSPGPGSDISSIGQVGQERSAPQGERHTQTAGRGRRIAAAQRSAGVVDQPPEALEIQLAGPHVEAVSRVTGVQDRRGAPARQRPTESGDEVVQRKAGGHGRGTAHTASMRRSVDTTSLLCSNSNASSERCFHSPNWRLTP